MDKKKTLIATIGLPRSGKSTWAREQGLPIVNPDSIRLAIHGERYIQRAEPYVWLTAKTMVDALFFAGHDTIIVDATNTTLKRREFWLEERWETYFKVIDTSAEICEQRARQAGDNDIIPIIHRMAKQQDHLCKGERQWIVGDLGV